MHPELDLQISIDDQLKRLVKLYKPVVGAMVKGQNQQDVLFRVMLEAVYAEEVDKIHKTTLGGGWNLADILAVTFLLQKNYRLAWLSKAYLTDGWWQYIKKEPPNNADPSTRSVLVDEAYFSNLRMMWEIYDSEAYVFIHKILGRCRPYKDPSALGAIASPTCEAINEKELMELFQELTKHYNHGPSDGCPDPTMLFNPAPKNRHAKYYSVTEFHLKYDSLTQKLFRYVEVLLANEKDLDVAEYLFRIRNTISRRNPPKVDECSPRLVQVSSMANCLDYWLLARMSENPRQRKALGWMAVYWLLENLLSAPEKYSLWGFQRPFVMLCGLIGEFGLYGEDQAEFERQMKLFVSMGSKSLARRMLEDPIAPSLADMGGISGAEAVALYRKIAAEHSNY